MRSIKDSLKLNITFLDMSRWMALLCAFGIPWSNASFNIGFYCMLIFFVLSLSFTTRWKAVFKTPTVLLALALFSLVSLETIFSQSDFNLAKYDLIHYRKLLAIPIFVALFTTYEHKKQLLICYCLGVAVLMLPTLLDGFGLNNLLSLNITSSRNAAYSESKNGIPNLVYWRNQIVHGFHVSILFSASLLGALYYKKYRTILLVTSGLCAIDLLFFVYGRMALLSFIIAIVTILIIYSPSKKWLLLSLVIITLCIGVTYQFSQTVRIRVNSISSESEPYNKNNTHITSGGIRLYYWHESWELFKQSPIIGNGSGSFRQLLINSNDPIAEAGHRHPHNEYLMLLSQYGIFGFLLLISIILISLKNANKIEDPWLSNVISVAIIVFACNGLTDSSLHNDWEGWAFVMFASIACFNISLEKNKSNKISAK